MEPNGPGTPARATPAGPPRATRQGRRERRRWRAGLPGLGPATAGCTTGLPGLGPATAGCTTGLPGLGPTTAGAPPPPPGTPRYPGPMPGDAPSGQGSGPIYAGWGTRLLGYLVDFAIFLVVLVILFVLLRHSHVIQVHFSIRRHGVRRRHTVSGLPFLIAGVLYIAYGTVLCGSPRGQTVGMMAVGVRAVRDGTFERLGYARALGRALFEGVLRVLELVIVFLGIVWLLDMLWPLWDKKRQTLHDKAAGSVVLRVGPRPRAEGIDCKARGESHPCKFNVAKGGPVSERSFTHLHTHTEFSMLGRGGSGQRPGGGPPWRTDSPARDHRPREHDGVLDFYKACLEPGGIVPIIGTEAYMAGESRHERPVRDGERVDDSGRRRRGGPEALLPPDTRWPRRSRATAT